MTIEIHSPEAEAIIEQRLRSGKFSNPEEVILDGLRSSDPASRTGAALIAAMQVSPHKDIELEPSRSPMPTWKVYFRSAHLS